VLASGTIDQRILAAGDSFSYAGPDTDLCDQLATFNERIQTALGAYMLLTTPACWSSISAGWVLDDHDGDVERPDRSDKWNDLDGAVSATRRADAEWSTVYLGLRNDGQMGQRRPSQVTDAAGPLRFPGWRRALTNVPRGAAERLDADLSQPSRTGTAVSS